MHGEGLPAGFRARNSVSGERRIHVLSYSIGTRMPISATTRCSLLHRYMCPVLDSFVSCRMPMMVSEVWNMETAPLDGVWNLENLFPPQAEKEGNPC